MPLHPIHVPGRVSTGCVHGDGLAAVSGSISLGWRSVRAQMRSLF
jgi:hypothetical protein